MRQPELSMHDIGGFLGLSLEVLERVYGHHRTHHQRGIDAAISKGQIGKDKFDIDGYDGWSYSGNAPTDTDRMSGNYTKQDKMKMSKRSINTKKLAERDAA